MSDKLPILLQLSILFPFLAAVLLAVSGWSGQKLAKPIAFIGFTAPALIAVYLMTQFGDAVQATQDYAFYSVTYTGLENFGIALKLGINSISLPLYLLAAIVGLAAGCYAIISKIERQSLYLTLLLVMQAGLMGTFVSVDIFFFYFFHELALIPTFIMIGIWGGRGRRTIAMELTIYLTLGAMLSLIGLIALYVSSDLSSFDLVSLRTYVQQTSISAIAQKNIFALLMFGFGILVSLFPFHSWAPRGYGAAPTSAAMLHAGVLKKFGLYGLIQIALPLLPEGSMDWVTLLAWLALGNVVIIGLITIAQRDLKQMIGYSSVMHMGYCFLGIACLSSIGIGGAILLMFAHGLSVSLLFLLSAMLYKRTETFDMTQIGGLCKQTPVLCAFFVAATMANIGLPGFANFWGEISIFVSIWNYQPWILFPAVAGIVISAVYGLRAVANIFFGPPTPNFSKHLEKTEIKDISICEKIPALILLIALFYVGFFPKTLTNSFTFTQSPTANIALNHNNR